MITVIDYGMGNMRSVVKAVEKYTSEVQVSSEPQSIASSKALIMPGDGAFGQAMENLTQSGWIEPLVQFIGNGGYFFGICLGYQLLFTSSEEFGNHKGLDIIPGTVIRFPNDLKVPHMGWNQVELTKEHPVVNGIPQNSYFYFIHTYYPVIGDSSWIMGQTAYGVTFPSIVGRGNCIATQFHPEKSHRYGLTMIENFVRMVCS
ncbi:MAG: imidazole glycerol phosphate synthase subunit HisH [Spirochaetes bacterium]|jgi:glutamine amidotransferase|nr:imidazole glycerol phosphate synthase subunit HisH [Spirochaetota bacterium]